MTGVSKREFARLDGCDEKLVRRKVTSGHLATLEDGTIDPALAGTGWRKRTGPKPKIEPEIAEDDNVEAVAAVAKRIAADPGFVMLSKAEAEEKKENYLALLRELEYDLKSKKVVLVEDVTAIVVGELARVRGKLMSIPGSVCMRAAILKKAEEIKDLVAHEIAIALEELTCDVRDLNLKS